MKGWNAFRRALMLPLWLLMLVNPIAAQDTPLQSLDTWGLNRGWEGVGLLMVDGRVTCTGALIRSDLVLTAAHCLYDLDRAQMTDPKRIEFRAGWRDGKAVARRMGRQAVVHSEFSDSARNNGDQIRKDVGLLRLATPIPTTHADPFRTESGIVQGSKVSVVSYGAGRNNAPSRQRSCGVLQSLGGLFAMSCDVVPGSSGSPVFAMHNGRPRIVSLVSSLGEVGGEKVSYGMAIEQPLAHVLADLRAGRGVYPRIATRARTIGVGPSRKVGGALFLRP